MSQEPVYDFTHSRVLITGGLGFIPRFFIDFFLRKYPEAQLWNLDSVSYCSASKGIAKDLRESSRYHFLQADVRNREVVAKTLKDNGIDAVFNFAAATHVSASFSDPMQYAEINVIGTLCVLEEARRCGTVQRFIHVSTDEVYGDTNFDEPVTETHAMDPTNPYSASKVGGDLMARAYFHSFRLPVICVRPCNAFGPTQHPEKLFGRFATLLRDGEKLTVHGEGGTRRCFLHAGETGEAVTYIAAHGKVGEAYNITSPHEYTVMDIAKFTLNVFKGKDITTEPDWKEKYLTFVEDRPYNDTRYFMCGDKLEALGWKPTRDFQQSFAETIRWYLDTDLTNFWGN